MTSTSSNPRQYLLQIFATMFLICTLVAPNLALALSDDTSSNNFSLQRETAGFWIDEDCEKLRSMSRLISKRCYFEIKKVENFNRDGVKGAVVSVMGRGYLLNLSFAVVYAFSDDGLIRSVADLVEGEMGLGAVSIGAIAAGKAVIESAKASSSSSSSSGSSASSGSGMFATRNTKVARAEEALRTGASSCRPTKVTQVKTLGNELDRREIKCSNGKNYEIYQNKYKDWKYSGLLTPDTTFSRSGSFNELNDIAIYSCAYDCD